MQTYGTDQELDQLVDSLDVEDKIFIANKNYGLDKLIYDKDYRVRRVVASKGYDLDRLINDPHSDVRGVIAKLGYRLDILINDKDKWVRYACVNSDAWPEYCANNWKTLVNNSYWDVRAAVAVLGYGIDILINDEDSFVIEKCIESEIWKEYCANNWETLINAKNNIVCMHVAKLGYGLNKLINDESSQVNSTVKSYLRQHRYNSIDDWIKANPYKVYN